MKKLTIIGIFVLGLIIPNIDVKAVDVSNEEELRAAIAQGGDIQLQNYIEITQPLVIDKDVNISGYYNFNNYSIVMRVDNTLMTVNSGNVTLDADLIAGWNGDKWINGSVSLANSHVIKDQGKALVINGGTVNLKKSIYAGKVGLEINGGNITGRPYICAGEEDDNYNYSGGQGMIVNGGSVELGGLGIRSGGTALTVNNGSNVTLEDNGVQSYEGNGIEVNEGSIVNIKSTSKGSSIFGAENAIYLNGGTVNLNGKIGLSSSTTGKGIYINNGVNIKTGGDVLNLGKIFVFSYEKGTTPNFSIYVNSDIKELRVTDEKGFMELLNNKLSLDFCGGTFGVMSQSEEQRKATCSALNSTYDGPIESNELNKCTVVYINGEKQNKVDASCNPVVDKEENNGPQIVEVPSTSAYGSIIIAVLGIVCVIVSVLVMEKVTKKAN